MYCTSCEIITEDLSHYKSELHSINVKRKMVGLPPLSLEELYPESKSDEISLDLYQENNEENYSLNRKIQKEQKKKCLFCEQDESINHYFEHGLSAEQITYINNIQCYVCYERFVRKEHLLAHLQGDVLRTAVTDGVSLYLMNGKVLNPDKKSIPLLPSIQREEPLESSTVEDHYYNSLKDEQEFNKFKISKTANNHYKKKPN